MTATFSRQTSTLWDGTVLFGAFQDALVALAGDEQRLNDLNVFPVPDGDTGTNMAATLRAGVNEASRLPAVERANAGAVTAALHHGALMKANGNSGLILSQIMFGFAHAFARKGAIDGRDLATALDLASAASYRAVLEPAEGTILTVVRIASLAAATAAASACSIEAVLESALTAAEQALAETQAQLPSLRDAGVIDAGGLGFVHILRALLGRANGGLLVNHKLERSPAPRIVAHAHGLDEPGYCTNFMIVGVGIPYEQARMELSALGTSAVIAGDDSLLKVHIHTDHPGKALERALVYGDLIEISIENMQRQMLSRAERLSPAGPTAPALIAIADGDGLQDVFRSLGATVIPVPDLGAVSAVEWMKSVIEQSPAREIVLLPHTQALHAAALQLLRDSDRTVWVVDSTSVQDGLAALAAYSDRLDPRANVDAMNEALRSVRSLDVEARQDGTFVAVSLGTTVNESTDETDALIAGLSHVGAADAELITIFTGARARFGDGSRLRISVMFPNAELDILHGGQAGPLYIVSVE